MNSHKLQNHLLVIGGTGMLAEVALYFANQYQTVSVIARHTGGLIRLKEQASIKDGNINPIAVDYRNYQSLQKHVSKAVKEFGKIDTIISWIHSTAPDALHAVCQEVEEKSGRYKLFEILSSSDGGLANYHEKHQEKFRQFTNLSYYSIVLGSVKESGKFRWLRNREISQGVISSVEHAKIASIIGIVR